MKMYRPIKQWDEWVKTIAVAFFIFSPLCFDAYINTTDGQAQFKRVAESRLIQKLIPKDEKYRIVKHEGDSNVIEIEFPYNSRRVWHDKGTDGNLDAISSAYASGRGYAFQVLQEGDKGFEFAKKEYRENIFPHLNKGTNLKSEQ